MNLLNFRNFDLNRFTITKNTVFALLHNFARLKDENIKNKPLDSVLWTESIQQVALLYSPCFPYNFSPLKRILMYRSHLCRLSSHMNVLHGRDYIIIKLYAIIIPSKKKATTNKQAIAIYKQRMHIQQGLKSKI